MYFLRVCSWVVLVTSTIAQWHDVRDTPEQRAKALLANMTLQEKILMVHGTTGPYIGNVAGNTRLGIPPLNLNDGPQGFRDPARHGTTTQWPSGLSIAASWDLDALQEWGSAMGREFAAKGANVQLGPGMCVARIPVNGRNFEYLAGEDPYLGYQVVQPVIKGIQSQRVIANAKHYINNNQETNRMIVSADLDERTRMEIYHPPFQGAVDAGVLSVMCSYNKINGVYACQNNQTLNVELKGIAGFKGWVMSDWGATHSTDGSALSGLDQEMPGGEYFGKALEGAIQKGTVPQSVVDDKVLRILTPMFAIGLFDHPNTGKITNNVTSVTHNTLCRKLAATSAVLIRNEGNLLPLSDALKKVVVVGEYAATPITGGLGSGEVVPYYKVSVLEALREKLGAEAVTYNNGRDPHQAGQEAAKADVAVVVVATTSTEGLDRLNLNLPQVAAIEAVGEAQPHTVVIVVTPGAILTPWSDKVAAILTMFMPGQEEGHAALDVLFGTINPSARLPLTFPNKGNEEEFTRKQYPGVDLRADYSEKLNVGYRWYATHKVVPKYPFGHGLSYTTFEYTNLRVTKTEIQVTVKNNGTKDGTEVAQLYVKFPAASGEPPLQLKGFQKILIKAGQSAEVKFTLTNRDVSIWDVSTHSWSPQSGDFGVMVGASSQDIRLRGSFTRCDDRLGAYQIRTEQRGDVYDMCQSAYIPS